MTTEYMFKRISKGKEFATVTGTSREEAEASITYRDIIDHEDFEWGDWQLVDAFEFTDEGAEIDANEELDDDPEVYG